MRENKTPKLRRAQLVAAQVGVKGTKFTFLPETSKKV